MSEKNLMERMIELGLGMAAYSEEKVSEFVREVSARGEEKRKDVEKMKKELKEKATALQKEFGKRVHREVKAAMENMRMASNKDLESLRKRIEELEKKLTENRK